MGVGAVVLEVEEEAVAVVLQVGVPAASAVVKGFVVATRAHSGFDMDLGVGTSNSEMRSDKTAQHPEYFWNPIQRHLAED